MKHQIQSEAELRAITGDPVHELILAKSTTTLTPPLRRFIEMSPFACLATHSGDGSSDISPRGDKPGWIHILDNKTLVIPDRPGNKRLDSIVNIIDQPRLSLLFLIPGTLETVRVNGSGAVTNDPELLALFPVNGKLPALAIIVSVEEAFGHCSKAFRRSRLWESDYIPSERVPTLAEMMASHLQLDQETTGMLEFAIDDDAKNNMY